MAVTLRDIASYTNVSVSTVSRALNQQQYVDDATRSLVQQAAEELGYPLHKLRPKAGARTGRLISLLTHHDNPEELEARQPETHVIEQLIVVGARRILEQCGYEPRIQHLSLAEEHVEHYVADPNIAGIILMGGVQSTDFIRKLMTTDLRFVVAGSHARPLHVNSVIAGYRFGVEQVVAHLVDKGKRNISNLFLAGRIISASHVAFGTTRVMATCANSAQAVAMAAVLCRRDGLQPADISEPTRMADLQLELMRRGQHIPGFALDDPDNLAAAAKISASSCLMLDSLPDDGPPVPLDRARAQMLPLDFGPVPSVAFTVDVAEPTTLLLELRTSSRTDNQTPDVLLATKSVALSVGANQQVVADFNASLAVAKQAFYCLMANEHIVVHTSETRITGVLSLTCRHTQQPDRDIGVEVFDFWCPERRPGGHNMAVVVDPPIALFSPKQVISGIDRPTSGPNAWVAAMDDGLPTINLEWPEDQTIVRVELAFDVDFDHPMESALFGHPEAAMPFCVKHYRICDDREQLVAEVTDNHQGRNTVVFDQPLSTKRLSVHLLETHGNAPASLFGVRCYADS